MDWLLGALVFGLVLACYWPALRGGLLWDDDAHLTRPDLRSWAGLGRIWADPHATQQYYPVLHSAFWIEHRLWGDDTLGYHLLNVLLHAASCCLLVLVLRRLRRLGPETAAGASPAPPAASAGPDAGGAEWLAALIFAVHPVEVESVAWISEQKNTLSLVFYLLAAWAYLNFDRTVRESSRAREGVVGSTAATASRRRLLSEYALASALFLLALGTKTVTATLPAALLVVLWWRRGRLGWRRDVRPLVPWFLAALAAGLFTAWIERTLIGAEGAGFGLTAVQRLLLAGRVIWFYLEKLFWPEGLMFIYPHWDVGALAGKWWGYLLGASGVTLALGIYAVSPQVAAAVRRWLGRGEVPGPGRRGLLSGWLFFVGSLFPALGFFNVYPFLYSYVADHFQYLAGLGLIVPFAFGADRLRSPRPVRAAGWVLCGLLVAGLAFLSRRESAIYRDGETLYRATLARNPDCWMAHNNLATLLSHRPGSEAEAIAHYREVVRLKPDAALAHYNLGIELAKTPAGVPAAIAQYEEALRLQPRYFEAHCNLALLLSGQPGREAEAVAHYEAALRLRPVSSGEDGGAVDPLAGAPGRESGPGYFEANYNLAVLLSGLPGRRDEAIARYEEALRLRPSSPEAHNNLALLLSRLPGREAEAAAHYQEALRLRPGYAEAHNNFANLLARLPGRRGEAVAQYREALRLRPAYFEAHYNLANLLAFLPGGTAEAAREYEQAVRLRPGYVPARNDLGVAYARLGRPEDARREWEEALRLDPNFEYARRNLARLQALEGR